MQKSQHISNFLEKTGEFDGQPLLVLLGPTASGKTALSIKIAQEHNGEIISADSRQVYRGMDIGTDKIPTEERAGIPHHLLDVAEPDERFTVADFKRLAEEKIDAILARGRLPILCGGTGLYIRAVTENFQLPPEHPEIRERIKKKIEEEGAEALHRELSKLDPESAAKIPPQNIPYLTRALEICYSTGRPKRDLRKQSPYKILQIGLNPSREILFERIEKRADRQIEKGLIDEVKTLLSKGFSPDLPALRTLGYREIIEHLAGRISLEEAVRLIKQNTRNFAKRQMTWFKKDREVMWMKNVQ